MTERDKHGEHFQELSGEAGMNKIAELIKGIRICMMSTATDDGKIHSRPMATQDEPFDGTVWFLTRRSSSKVDELQQRQDITLDYADTRDSKYITLRGQGTISDDRAKIKEMWNPMYKAWFPNGEDDPDIAVLRVDVIEGEFWEANSSKIIMGIRYVAAAVTGGSVPVGKSGHVEVDNRTSAA